MTTAAATITHSHRASPGSRRPDDPRGDDGGRQADEEQPRQRACG